MKPITVDNKTLETIEELTLFCEAIILAVEQLKTSRNYVSCSVVNIHESFEIAYNLRAQDREQVIGDIECYNNLVRLYKRPLNRFQDNRVTVFF